MNWRNIRLLVVDDAPDVCKYFADLAGRLGVSCDTASGGGEALSLIERNGPYDVYFIDWRMPGLDGITLTRLIKNKWNDKSAVVMISATEWNVIEEEAKNAGVDKFLPKPLFPSTIADCINECLGFGQIEDKLETEKTSDNFEGCRILLVEDVELNREIVLTLLEPVRLAVDCAVNGVEAVRMFAEFPERYDMILMDMQMPEMNGLEATRHIRAMDVPNAASVSIVAMTANVFREDIEKCLEACMNDHIGKPLDFEEVLTKLREYLPKGRDAR